MGDLVKLVGLGMIRVDLDTGGPGSIRLRRMGFISGTVAQLYANINSKWGKCVILGAATTGAGSGQKEWDNLSVFCVPWKIARRSLPRAVT